MCLVLLQLDISRLINIYGTPLLYWGEKKEGQMDNLIIIIKKRKKKGKNIYLRKKEKDFLEKKLLTLKVLRCYPENVNICD